MNSVSAVHNDRVSLGRPLRRPVRLPALALALVLAAAGLAGCGSDEEPAADPTTAAPTPSVNVPDGVTLTKAGTTLDFGESASVAYEPNPERNTVLDLTVVSVQQGRIADLSSYDLDEQTKVSTPYYVEVTVKNVGDGDVGKSPIPLWAVDQQNTLIQASTFTNQFSKCPSKALPTSFAPSAEVSTCLVYLVPDGGELTKVSFRPLQAFAPIEWEGTVSPPPSPKKKKAS